MPYYKPFRGRENPSEMETRSHRREVVGFMRAQGAERLSGGGVRFLVTLPITPLG